MSKFSQRFFTFLLGAFVGSLGAILVAPEPGDQTRSKLSYIIDRYVHLIRSFVLSWLYDNAEGESDAQSRGRAVLASAKEQAERLLHDVDNLVDRIKRK